MLPDAGSGHGFRYGVPTIPTRQGENMEGIRARLEGDGISGSVEFSLEEAMAHPRAGKPWAEMDAAEQDAALKDYALQLWRRQDGVTGNPTVTLERGTFAATRKEDV
jgi:hypothetical protein